MQAGGERLLIVPPELGYGKKKMSDIPPNSTLKFGERYPFLLPFGFSNL
jgi:FKBP-type peptidyl-prolyl cis-trans isomerase